MRFLKDRKADAKYLSVYWFVILVIVAAAIVFTVSAFYSQSYDVRKIESDILINNFIECFSNNGKLRILPEELDVNNCNLNFNDQNYNEGQYFLDVRVYNLDDCDSSTGECSNEIATIASKKGNVNYKSFCDLKEERERIIPVCSNKRFYSYYKNEETERKIVIDVLAIVNKANQNARK